MPYIYSITPFTQLDYPGELACVVWFSGCNLRCVFCHNPDIVLNKGTKDVEEALTFLRSRQGKLTGVVFSGGEATFCPALPELARQAKALGFKAKLDTNGANPAILKEMVGGGLLDCVALDYKCPPNKAEKIIGTARFEKQFYESLDYLIEAHKSGQIQFEVRTTISTEYMDENDISWIMADLGERGYQGTYWLQNVFASGDKTLGKIQEQSRPFDRAALPAPQGFSLGFRNFPEVTPYSSST